MRESELIWGCLNHNRDCQRELYRRYKPLLLSICRRYFKDKNDVEDALQDSFIKVFNNLGNYGFSGSFEGWLQRIAKNTCINLVLRAKSPETVSYEPYENGVHKTDFEFRTNCDIEIRKRLVRGPRPQSITDMDDVIPDERGFDCHLDHKILMKEVDKLPPGYYSVFIKREVVGLQHKEIAKILNISVNTSKTQHHKARLWLQKRLKKYLPESIPCDAWPR